MIRTWHRGVGADPQKPRVAEHRIITPGAGRAAAKRAHDRRWAFALLCGMRQEARDLVAGWRAR